MKAAVVTRYVNEVVTPFFTSGKSVGTDRPWEPQHRCTKDPLPPWDEIIKEGDVNNVRGLTHAEMRLQFEKAAKQQAAQSAQ